LNRPDLAANATQLLVETALAAGLLVGRDVGAWWEHYDFNFASGGFKGGRDGCCRRCDGGGLCRGIYLLAHASILSCESSKP
jgi:hypothetical protein